MPEHVHVHAPHELTEHEGDDHKVGLRERWLELTATLLLAVATLGIAWSGYQSARWSGLQAERYAKATATRTLANRADEQADAHHIEELLNFNRWLEAHTAGDAALADLYERRFRAEFRPAFEAWLASDPLNDPDAIASPFLEPEYRPRLVERARQLDESAEARFESAKTATEHTDDYVLITVFLAVVLFFGGISLRFRWFPMRVAILAMGGVVLVFAFIRLAGMPTH